MPDIKATITADGVNTLISKILPRSTQTFPGEAWRSFGPLRLRFAGARGHAEADPDVFSVIDPAIGGPRGHLKELDWVWERLAVGIGINIDEVCIGGWCIIPRPWGGCWVRAPRKCFFSSDPDVSATIDFAGLRHEISTAFQVEARPGAGSWDLFVEPAMPLDVDILDISDMVGDLLDRLVDAFVNDVLGFLPGWARNIVAAILGGIANFIRGALDLADDLEEWISEKLGVSLGLFDMVASAILEFFYQSEPLYRLSDPYPILPPANGDPAVLLDVVSVSTWFDEPAQTFNMTVTV